ncbi:MULTISPECIES: DUF1523 family protein [unclassified Haematobacter]|uniref:DUF1523 family protein n=1 Tax=unclassified Haematobacter TaxID=2640585 RepID=UPI0025C26E0E|nr:MULTISPECIES: DUF1523 family protein [unclassified Haematobacter]
MRYIKWTLIIVIVGLIGSFLHYTLPRHDTVRIVGTENRRVDFGDNSFFWASPPAGETAQGTRDVRFIQAIKPNGRAIVYRNEDTGWGWPPYFKMDSANLQARAQDLISSANDPKWVSVTRYGWRNEFFSIFPNAMAIRQVSGPDARVIPWASIIILTILFLLVVWIVVLWRRFRQRTIEPAMSRFDDAIDRADANLDEARDSVSRGWQRFTDRFRGKN